MDAAHDPVISRRSDYIGLIPQCSNRSKQILEPQTAYSDGTQYTRQSLNEKQHTWLHRQQVIVCEAMYVIFFIQTLPRIYAMKVMTSFGYEIMLTRGRWFQTLDVSKPWPQIPADRLLFLVFTHFFSDYPKAIRRGEISFKSNHVIERNLEVANSRVTGTSSGQL